MRMIPLTQNQYSTVDNEDYDWLMGWNWQARFDGHNWYAVARIKGKQTPMHRFILGITDPKIEVDHWDRNGLHNWRGNLRVCTHAQNLINRKLFSNNTTGYKGVYRYKGGYWRAKISVNGEQIHLGSFNGAKEAARAYDEAAKKYHGEFARLNFPDEAR